METQKKFTICMGETQHFHQTHSFVCLLDITSSDPDEHEVVSQIHIAKKIDGRMVSFCLNKELSEFIFEKTALFPLLSGYQDEMENMWEYLENTVLNADMSKNKFGRFYKSLPWSKNCRTGARDILGLLDLKLYREFTLSSAGLRARKIDFGPAYRHPVSACLPNLTKN